MRIKQPETFCSSPQSDQLTADESWLKTTVIICFNDDCSIRRLYLGYSEQPFSEYSKMQYIISPIFIFCVNYSNLKEQKATLISLIFFATVLWTKYIQCINKQTSPIYVVFQSNHYCFLCHEYFCYH